VRDSRAIETSKRGCAAEQGRLRASFPPAHDKGLFWGMGNRIGQKNKITRRCETRSGASDGVMAIGLLWFYKTGDTRQRRPAYATPRPVGEPGGARYSRGRRAGGQ